mmetsp:Transcript_117249/g.203677  ORF Transcript_117249/g.203677 Transcript_117249/m.203677 type:complete len:209 (+) Transcript_117249:389-1015(+)
MLRAMQTSTTNGMQSTFPKVPSRSPCKRDGASKAPRCRCLRHCATCPLSCQCARQAWQASMKCRRASLCQLRALAARRFGGLRAAGSLSPRCNCERSWQYQVSSRPRRSLQPFASCTWSSATEASRSPWRTLSTAVSISTLRMLVTATVFQWMATVSTWRLWLRKQHLDSRSQSGTQSGSSRRDRNCWTPWRIPLRKCHMSTPWRSCQ